VAGSDAKTISTRGLTEGAILAALVALFAVATRYLPLVGIATALLCPLPLAVLVIRHGLRVAVIAAGASGLVGAALAGPLVGFAILISFAPMGLVIGTGAARGWPAGRVVAAGSLVSAVSTALSFLGLLGGGRMNPAAMAQEMQRTMERSAAMATGLYARLGIPPEQLEAVTRQMTEAARLLPYLLPASFVLGAVLAAWLNYEVARRVLGRFGFSLHPLPPARQWRLPAWTVWAPVLGFVLSAAGPRVGGVSLAGAGLSLLFASMIAFMFQGLLATWVILGNLELSRRERWFAVVLVFMLSTALPFLNLVLFYLGIADSLLKVRDRWGLPRDERSKVRS